MISNILLIISITMVLIPYLLLFISYLSNKEEAKITASEMINKILKDNNINYIEDKNIYFSHYNIKRKMIKLSTKTYYSNKYFSLAIASLLAGYSMINDKAITYLSKIINKLKIITIIPIISILLSIFAHTIKDSKIALILLIIIAIIEYIIYNLTETAIEKIKIKNNKINKIINTFTINNKIFFIATLIQILRIAIIII